MQPSLSLSEEERLCFMQALNAVAYRNKKNPEAVWMALLDQFSVLLGVAKDHYQFQAVENAIAQKVNQIANPHARLYFLRIIHDTHLAEVEGLFWNSAKESSLEKFGDIYGALSKAIRLD